MRHSILIVEDELLIAEDIKLNLEELHYDAAGIATRASEANKILEEKDVHLALLDINIKGELDGIELGEAIKKKYAIPIVYLTSNSDRRTVERAVSTEPSGYVVKPYNKMDLYTTLALALHSSTEQTTMAQKTSSKGKGNAAFFKIDGTFTKILFGHIMYFRTAGNYIEIHKTNGVSLIRMTVKELFKTVDAGNFIRIHKSYVVNADMIKGFNGKEVILETKNLPMGGVYKDEVYEIMNID